MRRRETFSAYVEVDLDEALEAASDDQLVDEIQSRIDNRAWKPKKRAFDVGGQSASPSDVPPDLDEALWRLSRGELGYATRLIARVYPSLRELPNLVEKKCPTA